MNERLLNSFLVLIFVVCFLAVSLFFIVGEKALAVVAPIALIGFYAIFARQKGWVLDERGMRNYLDAFRVAWTVMLILCLTFYYFYQIIGREGYYLIVWATLGAWALGYFIFNKIR